MGSKVTDDMDVDTPSGGSSSIGSTTLKRCSSAPMINEINNTKMNTSPSPTSATREPTPFNVFIPRARRFSASYSPHSAPSTPGGPRLTPRVKQLRQEEAVDVTNIREVAHEREIHSAMQMSQSWEDLTLVTENLTCKTDMEMKPAASTITTIKDNNSSLFQNRMLPLNISLPIATATSSSACSSPSPTRCSSAAAGGGPPFTSQRQCFSPGMHIQQAWKTSMSPSPTRKSFTTRRSLSPIAMRPSSLNPVKRKFELDETDQTDNKTEPQQHYLCPPAKRFHSLTGTTTTTIINNSSNNNNHFLNNNNNNSSSSCNSSLSGGNGQQSNSGVVLGGGGLLIARHNNTSSPLPGSLSSVGTPESLSSADSPGFTFHPVDSPPTPSRGGGGVGGVLIAGLDEPMNTDNNSQSNKTAGVAQLSNS